MPASVRSLVILIPAAGASRRMGGRDKLMEMVDGQPVLRRVASRCLASGCVTLVTLPQNGPYGPERAAALSGLSVNSRVVTDAAEGLSGSLRAGAAFADGAAGLMVVLPDMPDIDLADLLLLQEKFAQDRLTPLRAADCCGKPGHPVIIPCRLFPKIASLRGDLGARALLDQEKVSLCPLPGLRATTDLDTAMEWSAWRSR